MALPSLDQVKDEIFAIIKESAGDLFENVADVDQLQDVALEMAKCKFIVMNPLSSDDEKADARDALDKWELVIQHRLIQGLITTNNAAKSTLAKIIGTIGRVLGSTLFSLL